MINSYFAVEIIEKTRFELQRIFSVLFPNSSKSTGRTGMVDRTISFCHIVFAPIDSEFSL